MAAASARAANEEVVRRIFGAFAQKQGFALRDLFASDAVWIVPGDGVMAGVHRGRGLSLNSQAPIDTRLLRSAWRLRS